MKVYLIYKRTEDDKEDIFTSFHTNKNLAKFSIGLYEDMYIHESDMTENEYQRFSNDNEDKKLMVYKHSTHVGYIILRKCDAERIIRGMDVCYICKEILDDSLE